MIVLLAPLNMSSKQHEIVFETLLQVAPVADIKETPEGSVSEIVTDFAVVNGSRFLTSSV